MTDTRYPLELSPDTMTAMVDAAMRRLVPHIASLPTQPAGDTDGAFDLARELIEPVPQSGESYEKLFDEIFRLVPKSFNAAGPGYLAYIPGGGLFHTAVADLLADGFNRYVGVCAAAPALVQLESNVIRWFCELVGYRKGSGGVLTTGGSLANFTAIVTARRNLLPENFLNGTLYASDQVHHSVEKAALLAGFPPANIREIATDSKFRMRIDDLESAIAEDRKRGREPFLIVASAGTTNTGAVDPLEGIADVAAREKMWMHVDGAYGGFFVLTERGREVMRGIERADSITLDPHKGLFLPYGTGSLVVKNLDALRRAHSAHADYLPQMQSERELIDFCEISPELSRAYRGLRVWLPFKMHGIGEFAKQLDEKLDLTHYATAELKKIDGIEIVAEPQLSIVAFRYVRPGATLEETNALNTRLLDLVNRRKRVMVTPTVVNGMFVIRICVLSFRTHLDRMQMAIEDIRASVAELR